MTPPNTPPPPEAECPQGKPLSLLLLELFKEIFFQRCLCLYGCLGNAIFVFLLKFHSHTEFFFLLSVKNKNTRTL